jgi:hypothetical protein
LIPARLRRGNAELAMERDVLKRSPAWGRVLSADMPTLLEVRTDPNVPPIPPHATCEQAKDAANALLKGDGTGGA